MRHGDNLFMKNNITQIIYKTNNSLFLSKDSKKETYFNVQFTGIANSAEFFSTKLQYKKLCSKDEFSKILETLEPAYKDYFNEILDNFRKELKNNPHFFKGMPEEIKTFVKDGHIINVPEKGFMGQFLEAASAPFTFCINSIKNKFLPKEKLLELKKIEQIKNNLASVEGLVEYYGTLKGKSPQEVKNLIQDKIRKIFIKQKANYSSNLSATLTELSSVFIAATYHGSDFYNITRRVDDNHDAAIKEAKVKVKQDFIRMGIMAYLTYIVTTLFKKDCNRSMTRMLAVASLIQIAAEIINRKVTGRPILPLNEQSLSEYNQKQKDKSNRIKKTESIDQFFKLNNNDNNNNNVLKNRANIPSFTGSSINNFFSKELVYSKKELQNLMELTEKINPVQAKRYSKLIEEKLSGNLKGKKLTDIYLDGTITNLSLGKKESTFDKIVKCILIPFVSASKLIKKVIQKEKSVIDEFVEVKNYLAFVENLLKTKYKNKNVYKDKDAFNEFRQDIMNTVLGAFRVTEANYNTAHFAIIKRLFSYSIAVAFIATDVFNVTLMHSDGDKKKASIQAKQRIVQDITRFFISIYTASSSLTLLGRLYNETIGNAIGITLTTSFVNNYLTRAALGMPIGFKNKEQLDAQDERNKKSFIHKTINKLVNKGEN